MTTWYSFGGSTKNMNESFAYAVGALGLAVIFIYMILASQFRSFLQPLALMSSLPLTLIGVVLALLLFGSTLNMFSIPVIALLSSMLFFGERLTRSEWIGIACVGVGLAILSWQTLSAVRRGEDDTRVPTPTPLDGG